MNFLFISHYANAPAHGNPYRTYYFSKALVRLGHKVTIVAAATSHLRLKQPLKTKGIRQEEHDGITYLFLPSFSAGTGQIARVLNIMGFMLSYLFYKKSILKSANPDVVVEHTTYILPIFITTWISKKAKAILIFEVRDLWPASPIEISGKSKYHPFFQLINWAQYHALKRADCVVSTLRYADQYYAEHFISPKAFAHIQNGVDADLYLPENMYEGETFRLIQNIKMQHSGCVGYTGGFGPANGLEGLLKAANKLAEEDIAIILVGKGPRRTEFDAFVASEALSNVYIFDAVPKAEIIPITQAFDLAFGGGVNRKIHRYGISPNKIFDYMLSETPILICYNTQDNFLVDAGCGLLVENPLPSSIATAVSRFFGMSAAERIEMGKNGRKAALEKYEYQVLTQSFLDVVENLR